MSEGIDIPIDSLVSAFESELWTNSETSYYGRVFRNERMNEGIIQVSPEIWQSANHYIEVLKNVEYDAQCFFDVQPTIQLQADNHKAVVWICFMVNLGKVYSAYTRTEATELVHFDTRRIIELSQFDITELVTGFEGFRDYDWSRENQGIVDMSPHYLFKYVTEIDYEITKC